jgi:hypothetical protein
MFAMLTLADREMYEHGYRVAALAVSRWPHSRATERGADDDSNRARCCTILASWQCPKPFSASPHR